MKRTNIHFPVPLLKKLRAAKKATGLTVAEIVRRAVEAFLKKD